ncbi:hypothetical protein SteCoe_37967 [Stentor coeruleus]|uniref:RING-type domain-containing protein n=1 Tax=Stentor coeruleus TaxID=5963 RepID=A0A1R2AM27_9CILI|nr:hypothetical protein SteCoe_37967 [Stentor coeruleus]
MGCTFCFSKTEEQPEMALNSFKICSKCENNKTSAKTSKCGCFLCPTCRDIIIDSFEGVCTVCHNSILNPIKHSKHLPTENKGAKLKNPEPLKKSNRLKTPVIYECEICLGEFSRDQMLTLDCNHYFCSDCLRDYFHKLLKEGKHKMDKKFPCVKCQAPINTCLIQSVLDHNDTEIYNKNLLENYIVECPCCSYVFTSDHKIAKCSKCAFHFCSLCKRSRKLCLCKSSERFSKCPVCLNKFIKKEDCTKIFCTNQGCKVEFCHICFALFSPILEHGNHYHHEFCRYYCEYLGNDDKYKNLCVMCKKEGKLCSRPM